MGWSFPPNQFKIENQAIIEISETHLSKKIMALNFYKSQSVKEFYSNPEQYIRSLAITNGKMIKKPFAEALEIIRLKIPLNL